MDLCVMMKQSIRNTESRGNPEETTPELTESHRLNHDHYRLSPALLASLQSLVEEKDHMLLPHSLHQVAETYFLEEDYDWAVEFLHLEQMYHERLISNLAAIQEKWETQRQTQTQDADGSDGEREQMEVLSHICRTHQRPLVNLQSAHTSWNHSSLTENRVPVQWSEREEELEAEEDDGEEDECWNEEQQESTDLHNLLATTIRVEEMFPASGLVSILKKGEPRNDSKTRLKKRKVRFRDPDDDFEQDESTASSCILLFVLCLVAVVVSLGGTALYCLVGEANSNVCVDFSRNADFYFGPLRSGFRCLATWFHRG